MATQLSAPKATNIPNVEATHYEHEFRHAALDCKVESFVVYGTLDSDGVFCHMNQIGASTHSQTIQGEAYDELLSSGSADGRFWPEDVLNAHIALATPEVVV